MKKNVIIWIIFVIVVVLVGIVLFVNSNKSDITNFEECIAAGNPSMQTYPRQCIANGQTFVEDICSSEARTIINKYNINEIENCQSKSFNLNGKDIEFIHLEYGVANDCPSGCFFSHYCAIVEDGEDYPYVFYFTNPNENILNSEVEDWRGADESILTGRNHELATMQEFHNFLTEERQGGGEFRWCN